MKLNFNKEELLEVMEGKDTIEKIAITVQEPAEFITAFTDYFRNKSEEQEVIDEIADMMLVGIMALKQMDIPEEDFEDRLQESIDRKMARNIKRKRELCKSQG